MSSGLALLLLLGSAACGGSSATEPETRGRCSDEFLARGGFFVDPVVPDSRAVIPPQQPSDRFALTLQFRDVGAAGDMLMLFVRSQGLVGSNGAAPFPDGGGSSRCAIDCVDGGTRFECEVWDHGSATQGWVPIEGQIHEGRVHGRLTLEDGSVTTFIATRR